MDGPLETTFPMQCNNKFYVYRETGIFESWPKKLILLAVSWFFPPFCFYAAVGLWNWNYLLFKRSWRFLQMWKVSFRRPFQRFGYYQKIDLSPWMRYHLCQVTLPQVFWGRLYVDTPCISPHHFLAVDRGHNRWVTLLECSRNGCIATNTDFIETFFF